jgi:Arc/MetJ-type ribon-helix-helix transcriptional regulator
MRSAARHRCIAICDTIRSMAHAISVRLDDEAQKALRALEASGMSRSEAIRSALVESARRLRRSSELAAEVAELDADETDRAEMTAVAQLMESLRAPG